MTFKPVPAKVLADYPDLQTAAPVPPEVTKGDYVKVTYLKEGKKKTRPEVAGRPLGTTTQFEVRFARKYTGEMKSVVVQAPNEIDAVPIARKQLGLDITEWIPERVIIPKAPETAVSPEVTASIPERLEKLVGDKCDIIKIHDDGDLTVECKGTLYVVTKEGEVFIKLF